MKNLEVQTKELALFLVKHDAVAQQEDIYAKRRIQQEGLMILHEQEVEFTPEITEKFYSDKRDEKFMELVRYITAGKSLAIVVCGFECYKKLGALKTEMRSSFSHGDINTGTHSSDDLESARREMQLLRLTPRDSFIFKRQKKRTAHYSFPINIPAWC